jgi:uncharacterized protein YbcI
MTADDAASRAASDKGGALEDVSRQPELAVLAGGNLLASISTRIVSLLREHYGRGPMRAKTYVLDDIIVVVMRGSGFTALEQTIMDSGQPDRVVEMREDFQQLMRQRYTETIKELTGRNVTAFLSQAHVDPDITIEIFFVDGPLKGFGALEITEPELLNENL